MRTKLQLSKKFEESFCLNFCLSWLRGLWSITHQESCFTQGFGNKFFSRFLFFSVFFLRNFVSLDVLHSCSKHLQNSLTLRTFFIRRSGCYYKWLKIKSILEHDITWMWRTTEDDKILFTVFVQWNSFYVYIDITHLNFQSVYNYWKLYIFIAKTNDYLNWKSCKKILCKAGRILQSGVIEIKEWKKDHERFPSRLPKNNFWRLYFLQKKAFTLELEILQKSSIWEQPNPL